MEDLKRSRRRDAQRPALPPPLAVRRNPSRAARPATAPTSASPAPYPPPPPPRAYPPPRRPRAYPSPPPEAGDILTFPNDNRAYRHILLSNQLNCVLVMDSSSDKIYISVNVAGAGYFAEDSVDEQGLAQLLQHTLLHDNPSFCSFQEFLSKHDGSSQSVILADSAYFCAHASTCDIDDFVARFARFFLEPSFSCLSSEIDMNSYHTEKSDLDKLQRYLTNQNHPYHKFTHGNMGLALESLKAKGPETTLSLRKFYESHYSADTMSIVIYGSDDLDHMEELAKRSFSSLRRSETKPYTQLMSLCTDDNFQILVEVPSMDGSKALRIQWLVERSLKKPEETDALKYILHVFNYNTEGSLFYTLKHEKKWSLNGCAHESDSHLEFSFLSLDITLTDEGMRNYEDVCGLVFRYITKLKAFKPKRYIFDELKRVRMEQMSSEEMVNPIEYAAKIASNILTFSPRYCLVGSVPMVYSEDDIRTVQDLLSPERVRIFLVGEFGGTTNLLEPVYKISYSIESVKGAIKGWIKNAPKVEMYLPKDKAKKAVHVQLHSTSKGTYHSSSAYHSTSACVLSDTSEDNEDWMKNAPKVEMYLPKEKAKKAVHVQPDSTSKSTYHSSSAYHSTSACVLSDTSEDNESSFVEQETHNAAKVCIIFDKRMENHVYEKYHQENPKRIQAIFDRLEADGLLNRCSVFDSEDAKVSQVMMAHSDDHFRRIIKGKITGSQMYFCPNSMEAILLAAGGAIKAADMVASGKFSHAFAVVRPPGHHASSDSDSGFCYLNNVAIAAKHLQKEYNFRKILIFDFDIHFGDGTSSIFIEDSSVLYVSMHFKDFPYGTELLESEIGMGDGTGYNCNVVWPKPVNDDDFCVVVDHLILPMASDYQPDIVLVSAGFDAALGDPYKYYVTPVGYATVIKKLLQLEKPLVLVLEGGYNPEVLGKCCSSCIKVLAGDTSMVKDKNEYTPLKSTWDSVTKLKGLLQAYFPSLGAEIPAEVISRCVDAHRKPREIT